jgi:hypothetical protein
MGRAITYGAQRYQPGVVAARNGELTETVAAWHRRRASKAGASPAGDIPA